MSRVNTPPLAIAKSQTRSKHEKDMRERRQGLFREGELELGLIKTQTAQKPMLRAEVYARARSVYFSSDGGQM
jgi:hypothetical protein